MKTTSQLTHAERLAETFGIVLGAASCCAEVTEDRLNATAAKAREVVCAAARNEAEADAANLRFSAALEAGIHAAEGGSIDPDTAETALSDIEQQLST
jgi:hypothetical protein